MKRFLAIIFVLLFFHSGYAQNRIGINYLNDTQTSSDYNYEIEFNTEFTISENGFISMIRLFNFNNEPCEYVVKVFGNSGNHRSLVAGPYFWKVYESKQGWREFEFPSAIPVYKNFTYTLSVSKKAQQVGPRKFLNSTSSYSYSINPGFSVSKRPVNNLLKEGQFNWAALVIAYPKLIAGIIGQTQTINFNKQPSALKLSSFPSGGTGTYLYQWQRSHDSISWIDITGANDTSYSPPALTANTWYRLKVTSGNIGTDSSNSVLIKVYPKLIASTIGNRQTIFYNSKPASLNQISLPSGGTGSYSYQWQNSPDNITWTDITGASLSNYSPPALKKSTWYRLYVISGDSIASNSLLITVYPELIPGTIGHGQTICYNTPIASLNQISLPSGGTGSYTYQWQYSPDNISWTDITGANLSSYSPPALTTSTWYRLEVISGNSTFSNSLLIKVNPELFSGTIGHDQTPCYNTAPEALVQVSEPSGGTGEYTFQWQISVDNISWKDIDNEHGTGYSPPALNEITWFRRAVTSGCNANSNVVRITPHQQVNYAQLSEDKTIYENTSTTFKVDVSGGTPPFTINYTVNGIAQPAIRNYISGTYLSTGILNEGTYRYFLTSATDINGCDAQSLGTHITITVLRGQVTYATNKALIVVNSASSSYSEYTTYIKPYLDNFGIPYDVCNVTTTSLPSFNDYAIIIFGHKNVYSSGYPITQLEAAVAAGAGLYSFDPHLFDYPSGFNNLITQRSASSTQINILNLGHFITRFHAPDTYNPSNNTVNLLRSWTVAQSSTLAGGIDLASMSSGSQTISVLQAADYGSGRIVKWCAYDWMFENILGPVYGMDDLIWRGIVWAARKPFIIQGMPPMLTMRVDDVDGTGSEIENNFAWVSICNEFGIKPWLGLFTRNIPSENIPTLRTLINSGYATASPHAKGYATTYSGFIYYNHDNIPSFDPASETRSAKDFFIQNGLAMSNFVVPHYYEYASSSLPEIRDMGVEFLGVHWLPDNSYNPSPDWINCAPYRINRYGTSSVTEARPVYYGGYVNINGIEFFNCLTEIRDDGGYEWFPNNSITATAARGVRHLRRAFNSMVLASLFTHEQTYIASISQTNWREILRLITAAADAYSPEYVSLDYAVKYIRAKSNIRITDVRNSLNSLEISYGGYNDMDTKCYLFSEHNGLITYRFITLPRVNGSYTVSVSN